MDNQHGIKRLIIIGTVVLCVVLAVLFGVIQAGLI